uniref:receptor protein serine/threonine kinase n=1 Tax=Gouania willdenowi TaxID=441366 RepID=A0A8C5GRF3_GOUWI
MLMLQVNGGLWNHSAVTANMDSSEKVATATASIAPCFVDDILAVLREDIGREVLLKLSEEVRRNQRTGPEPEVLHPSAAHVSVAEAEGGVVLTFDLQSSTLLKLDSVLLLVFDSLVTGRNLDLTFISRSLQPQQQSVCVSEQTQYILLTGRPSTDDSLQKWRIHASTKSFINKEALNNLFGGGNNISVTPLLLFSAQTGISSRPTPVSSSSLQTSFLCELKRFLDSFVPQVAVASPPVQLDTLHSLPPLRLDSSSSEALLSGMINSSTVTIFSFKNWGPVSPAQHGELSLSAALLEELRQRLGETSVQLMQMIQEENVSDRAMERLQRLRELSELQKKAATECIFIVCTCSSASAPKRRCVYYDSPRNHQYTQAGRVSGSVQVCEATSCCVGFFWMMDGQQKVDLQACDMHEHSCPDMHCKPQPRFNKMIKCVCKTDFCNSNISWISEDEEAVGSPDGTMRTTIAVVSVVLLFLMVCFWTAAKRGRSFYQHTRENPSSSCDVSVNPQCSCQEANQSIIDHSLIELQQVVGRGRFATVFQGKYKGSAVAVKCFPGGQEEKFRAEKEVYELPLMKNAGIVLFLGSGTKPHDTSFFIVMQFAEHGSLHSFLSQHSISWTSAFNMCLSLSQGLSYLHSDLQHNGVHKPSVAHRDLSSSNVLLRADFSCVLCDFEGSAVLRSCVGRQWGRSHTQNFQGGPEVGTLCYMSPELLERAVNLTSSSFMLQGDVYALALILWEVWMRCSHLFQDADVPQHLLPFELELGPNPSWEHLIHHVCFMNQRPSIPPPWDVLPEGCEMKRILTDCWDSDADARLTASCVVNCLMSLQSSNT